MRYLGIDKKIIAYELALKNSLNIKEIIDPLSVYGYNVERLNEGKKLLEEAVKTVENKKKGNANKSGTSDDLTKTTEEAHKMYIKTVKVSRVAYKNDVNAKKMI